MPKIKYSKSDWNKAKKFFIEGVALSRIEVLTGIPEDYLKQKRSKEGWVALKNKSKDVIKNIEDEQFDKVEDYIIESCDRQASIQLIEEIINIRLQQLRHNVNDDNFNLAKDLKSFAQTFIILKDLTPVDDKDDDTESIEDINIDEEDLMSLLPEDLIEKIKENKND